MGNPVLNYQPESGMGGHVTVDEVIAAITTWRVIRTRVQAEITCTGSNHLQGQKTILLSWNFVCESMWDTLKITPTLWKILHNDFLNDLGFLGPIQFDIGNTGRAYRSERFVLDSCEEVNSTADVLRYVIRGSCSLKPLTLVTGVPVE